MKKHRFLGDFDLNKKKLFINDPNLAKQLRKVLRKNTGDEIILFDGKGKEATAKLTKLAKNFIEVEIIKLEDLQDKKGTEIILYCSIIKKDNFEFVCQKVTELGVSKIIPVKTSRTIKTNFNKVRVTKIIKEACEQSGRLTLPEIEEITEFADCLKECKKNDLNLFFDINGKSVVSIEKELKIAKSIGLFIGPEGGWDKSEFDSAVYINLPVINISPFTLRAETAAIAAVSLISQFIF